MSLQERPYPYVVASSEKYRIVKKSAINYALEEWCDDKYDAMRKPIPPQWVELRCIWFEGNSIDYSIQPFIEIMENGWTTSGAQQP